MQLRAVHKPIRQNRQDGLVPLGRSTRRQLDRPRPPPPPRLPALVRSRCHLHYSPSASTLVAAAREMLAMLGAIPPLVAMLDESDGGGGGEEMVAAALYALLNLGIGNDTNKAAIVQAGAVHKMLRIAEGASGDLTEALVANFLCLSALDANKPIIG
uniref:Armadillo repeat-containing domain-containing protein n=1 Tax=Oryza barthii TaxID=65489 RepID=A0A0D3HCE5_9ORYZ